MQHPSAHVAERGDKPALVMGASGETLTYRQLEDASNRVAQLLRARGLRTGDRVAVLLVNRPTWYPVVWGALRAGLYVTPVNYHLAAAEAGYIVADCGARALVADAGLADTVAAMGADLEGVGTRLAVGGDIPGFEPYAAAAAAMPAAPIGDECEGSWMLYSSGTTGRPKGVKPPLRAAPLGAPQAFATLLVGLYGFSESTVYLSPAPLYHAAPAGWTTMTQRLGGTAVVMERFGAEEWLALVERHRATHSQLVPTHLVRLLKLPEEVRRRYDLSSLELVVHAAAPCPPEVKRAAIEWLGPIVHEFYSGSEGSGFCAIGPQEWLDHPGSVGRSLMGAVHIVGEGGEDVPAGEEGQVWFESATRFEYHGDPAKTATAWNDRGWSTMGDIGRLDADGYLYLTDRVANTIISGGVNVYPREAEDVLILHPAVHDVGVVGVPDDDLGQRAVAFVQPEPGADPDDALAAELVAWCRARLTHYKCPGEVRFLDELPRLPTGKLLKRALVGPGV
ncbi:MAG TPA: acyl-CoA synthetase [Acidimicrobiales bacterium]|nr:acyl-CoA synthetase [Acidimicrobiales bacterium]